MNQVNNGILRIAYFTQSIWIYPIINEINKNAILLKKYKKGDLSEWGISISTKLEFLSILVENINKIASRIKKQLKTDLKKVEECIKEQRTYTLTDNKDAFALLGYSESAIIQMQSIYEVVLKYTDEFAKILIPKGMREQNLLKICKQEGLSKTWANDLKTIRVDFFHNYSGWLLFRFMGNDIKLIIELPNIKNGKFKRFSKMHLDQEHINELIRGLGKFLACVSCFLTKSIEKYNQVAQ
ncbi:MAG: hypothetical protein KAW56_14390 [Candidatus Marinimicrobia bacterium]|nr:hypothetical protein [candidate division WOR-3 bacterium]MCK4448257.1 hypothetical protein [Candidatus Neomarinimicrobiota bacterium]